MTMNTYPDTSVRSTVPSLFAELRLVRHFCYPPCGDCPPLGITFDEYNRLQDAKERAAATNAIDKERIWR